MQHAPQGSTVVLSVQYRNSSGALIDPVDPHLTIARPSGAAVITNAVPAKVAVGVYRYSYMLDPLAVLGIWKVTWSGTLPSGGTAVQVAIEDVFEVGASGSPVVSDSPGFVVATLGQVATFDGVFRKGSVLVDPTNVAVQVYVNEFLTTSGAPTRLAKGVFRYSWLCPTNVSPGPGRIHWSGLIDGVAESTDEVFVVSPVSVNPHPFDSSVKGVQGLLPYLPITETSMPSIAMVETFLDDIGAEVSLRIGDYVSSVGDPALRDRILNYARYVTHLGSAAQAQDTSHPEQTGGAVGSAWGGVLWARYQAALDRLVSVVDHATPGEDPGAGEGGQPSGGLQSLPMFTGGMDF